MPSPRPTTIPEYIAAAPAAGRPHLRRIHAILRSVAPQASEVIKWGSPFFVEPRFLFAFSAHKAHCNFTAGEAGLTPFRAELAAYKTTAKGFVQMSYAEPLPEELLRRIAERRLWAVQAREDDGFW